MTRSTLFAAVFAVLSFQAILPAQPSPPGGGQGRASGGQPLEVAVTPEPGHAAPRFEFAFFGPGREEGLAFVQARDDPNVGKRTPPSGPLADGFTLSLSSKKAEFGKGASVDLVITLTNHGPAREVSSRRSWLVDLGVSIVGPDGREVPLNERGKWASAVGGSQCSEKLAAGQEISSQMQGVNKYFAMDAPGEYAIQVTEWCPASSDPSIMIPVRSNVLLVRVLDRAVTEEVIKPDWREVLRKDPKLEFGMFLQLGVRPPYQRVFEELRESTKLKISWPEAAGDKDVSFGNLDGLTTVPKLMEKIATERVLDGRWEKTADGYILHGKPKQAAPSKGVAPVEQGSPNGAPAPAAGETSPHGLSEEAALLAPVTLPRPPLTVPRFAESLASAISFSTCCRSSASSIFTSNRGTRQTPPHPRPLSP